jgi:hypothetical protein
MSMERARHGNLLIEPGPNGAGAVHISAGAAATSQECLKSPAAAMQQFIISFNDLTPNRDSNGFDRKPCYADGHGYRRNIISCKIAAMISSSHFDRTVNE